MESALISLRRIHFMAKQDMFTLILLIDRSTD
jgi:hypothetical protein